MNKLYLALSFALGLFCSGASGFTSSDQSAMFSNPQYLENGCLSPEGYKLLTSSAALDQGRAVVEPPFPNAG